MPLPFAEIYYNLPVHSYLVLRETQGFSRGDIVERVRKGHYNFHEHHSISRASERRNPTCLPAQDVAPLTEGECKILDGIDDTAARYKASSPGLLAWGVGLEVGDTVLARIPDKSGSAGAQQDQYTTAIIRWIGLIDGCGYRFGVEIMVR